jgi:N6-adenosine-specific RNA methylase IME4
MYRMIMADPPWLERGAGQCKRGADRHYDLMKTDDIIDLMRDADKWNPAEDCHLWLWVTNNFLPDGLRMMDALGFRYVTNLAWIKDRMGLGQYLRGQHELCLFGVRGSAMMPDKRNVPSAVFFCPKGEHSRKPEYVVSFLERVSPGPRLEMFARAPRDGWDVWGNQTDKYELPLLAACAG